ncbi:neurotensin/neuromedin N [Pseudochaenichthys georgianus]|uniref:neurotensin/neuromedin N n=1 Tax=Pseudochaenichthys georgianus TaxID=52239 RepID=UPI00146EDBEA|nr:neurotensin/neuromedin N [Pseudochaenichthys georgianus]
MQAQLACMLLLCFTCGGLCTGVDQDQRALEEDILNSLFASKMKQNKQSAPYWRVSLGNLCRLVSVMSSEEEEQEEEEGGQLREELYNLQYICRALREDRLLRDSQEYLEENSDTALKRKSPYILKRQAARTTKSRRPYILKRSSMY